MREIKFRFFGTATRSMSPEGWTLADIASDKDMKTLLGIGGAIPMQFTGLKDKNGKEIYEGDVVKHREREVGNLEVKFWNGEWIGEANDTAAQPLFDEDWWRKSKGADKITNIEVVGNIYENPELLK